MMDRNARPFAQEHKCKAPPAPRWRKISQLLMLLASLFLMGHAVQADKVEAKVDVDKVKAQVKAAKVQAQVQAVRLQVQQGQQIQIQQIQMPDGRFIQIRDGRIVEAAEETQAEDDDGKVELQENGLPKGVLQRFGEKASSFDVNQIYSLAGSPDGKQLAIGESNGRITVINMADRKVAYRLDAGPGTASRITFFDDGKKMMVTGTHNQVLVFDLVEKKLLHKLTAKASNLTSHAVSPDGKLLAVGGNRTVSIFDLKTGELKNALNNIHSQLVTALAFSADGKTLYTGSYDMYLKAFDVDSGKEKKDMYPTDEALNEAYKKMGANVVNGNIVRPNNQKQMAHRQPGRVMDMVLMKDGKHLLCLNGYNSAQVLEADTLLPVRNISGIPNYSNNVSLTPDEKYMIVRGQYSNVVIYDFEKNKQLEDITAPTQGMPNLQNLFAVAGDGSWFAVPISRKSVQFYEIPTAKQIGERKSHAGPILGTAIVNDKTVATSGMDGTLYFWNVATGEAMVAQDIPIGRYGSDLKIVDGKVLYCGLNPNTSDLVSFDENGKEVKETTLNDRHPRGFDATEDGKTIVVASQPMRTLTFLTDASRFNQKKIMTLPNDTYPGGVALSPTGHLVAIAENNFVSLWLVNEEERLFRSPASSVNSTRSAVDISDDGLVVAVTGYDRRIHLFESPTGALIAGINGDGAGNQVMRPFQFWPGRSDILVYTQRNVLIVRDIYHERDLARLRGHDNDITSLTIDADSGRILTGSEEGVALLWEPIDLPDRNRMAQEKDQIDDLWNQLRTSNGRDANRVKQQLIASGDLTSNFLAEKLTPARIENVRIEGLIAQLDDDDFYTREKASKALAREGAAVLPYLAQALRVSTSAEVRWRCELLMGMVEGRVTNSDTDKRDARAIQVLEAINDERSQQTIEALARGADGAYLTRLGQQAAMRMGLIE